MNLKALSALLLAIAGSINAEQSTLRGFEKDANVPEHGIAQADTERDLSITNCKRGYKYNTHKHECYKHVWVEIQNGSWQQPLSPYFVMVHKAMTKPLYKQGEHASHELARLAEDGNPTPLVDYYKHVHGVYQAFAANNKLTHPGDSFKFKVYIPYGAKLTLASMAVNTNDCFVAVNGVDVKNEARLALPGLDAGTEANNEKCNSIPGPACNHISHMNEQSGHGEGFVHVHRGIVGHNDINVSADWRNPMAFVTLKDA
mmetsp:Transcript_21149/g.37458  ORF Transcript_21149/g.37458 Transcript_21149/m.37458 type:complete len:258 (+) Transcript_21149:162-935(+)|eukprot:CAMPEP_0184540312 /NCGR_PEP_ID=MMETSP0199_2-20130426/67_1 /TAXON_ID=1112570 /ORGANISM="Thraustochytrium sp., Strain LLF1b" /LENGTH=257 /DNA_ID=CAMNT_0026933871 /DNA_START=159 /DNA_END=932 /DNA_ORIENTATION=+